VLEYAYKQPMTPTLTLTEAVVSLVRNIGPRTGAELHAHFREHKPEAVDIALTTACTQLLLKRSDSGTYSLVPLQDGEEVEAGSIVAHALRNRSVLELGWYGALA
jgi:hypothetical protein